jgi:hypothetical protein
MIEVAVAVVVKVVKVWGGGVGAVGRCQATAVVPRPPDMTMMMRVRVRGIGDLTTSLIDMIPEREKKEMIVEREKTGVTEREKTGVTEREKRDGNTVGRGVREGARMTTTVLKGGTQLSCMLTRKLVTIVTMTMTMTKRPQESILKTENPHVLLAMVVTESTISEQKYFMPIIKN